MTYVLHPQQLQLLLSSLGPGSTLVTVPTNIRSCGAKPVSAVHIHAANSAAYAASCTHTLAPSTLCSEHGAHHRLYSVLLS
jgi:hypothetical protein